MVLCPKLNCVIRGLFVHSIQIAKAILNSQSYPSWE